MKKWIPLLILILVIFTVSAMAQSPLHFQELVIEIWPEYDRPDVLIIYRGYLSPEVSLPAQITFQIPAQSGQPNAVAVRAEDGTLVTVDYERVVQGNLAEISFITPSREIQFEYYDPALQKEGSQRTFVFDWREDMTSGLTVLRVQNPAGARDMQIDPPFSSNFRGSDGLVYYTHTLEDLQNEDHFPIQIQYLKADDSLSIEDKPVQPSVPINPGMFSGLGSRNVLAVILGTLGIALIITAVILYWRFGNQRKTYDTSGGSESAPGGRNIQYCTRCGSKINEDDKYCRNCGNNIER